MADSLEIVPAVGAGLDDWRRIHNLTIPSAPLSAAEVAERATRHRLTLAFDRGILVGNATVRPPHDPDRIATVIVRILPDHRRRGRGSRYLAAELAHARSLAPLRIETVVSMTNPDGLAFALRHGFVEHDRYVLDGDTDTFVDLHLASGPLA